MNDFSAISSDPLSFIKGTRALEPDKCVHELFERQADRTPDTVAVVFDDQQLTYRELDSRANQLARYLVARGVGPEVLVGICVERSLEMIVGILAILKAGGAYLPLDPAYPFERLDFMLNDANAPLLLTQANLVDRIPGGDRLVICLDTDWDAIARESYDRHTSGVTSDNVAYVIYTSGSTGQPKGVMVTHRNVARLFSSTDAWFGFDQQDVWTLFHSLAFDFSVWEIWGALIYGGRLVIVPYLISRSPEAFYGLLKANGVTVLNQTPSAFRQLVRTDEDFQPNELNLRLVIFGGEALDLESLRPWIERHGYDKPQLINMYGITETTVHVTYRPITIVDLERQAGSVIGRPIPDLQIHVLDEAARPLPAGTPGEIYVGGAGVTRGYLNRPALTAERFIDDPFSDQPGARLYRTGDRARTLRDGDLEYLGRADHQVKIRGFRIELGEIESVLRHHSSVRDCVVMAREDTPGDRRLVAYIIPQDTSLKVATNVDVDVVGSLESVNSPSLKTTSTTVSLEADNRITQWQSVFDGTYHATAPDDPTFNIAGWNSSYTGRPIPAAEMREWLDQIVERVLSLQPRRVLEIGCGTGILLYRLAPHCEEYVGADFSQTAIDKIRAQVSLTEELRNVRLMQRDARDFHGFTANSFDTIILNSVVQYFPNVDYLIDVLRGALRVLRPDGAILIGDVRSLPLLDAFHAAVELQKASASTTLDELRSRVYRGLKDDVELALHPDFFRALGREFPEVSAVLSMPKRGRYLNELNQFRYDVILRTSGPAKAIDNVPRLHWRNDELSAERLRGILQRDDLDALLISDVPNKRVAAACGALSLLKHEGGVETVADLIAAASEPGAEAVDPEDLLADANEAGWKAQVSWQGDAQDGAFHVLFTKCSDISFPPLCKTPLRHWREYANRPAHKSLFLDLIPNLRSHLRKSLPDYMVPSAFVLIDQLPLTAHGKLDCRTLPRPRRARPGLEHEYVAPRNETEELLARVCGEVLGIDQVGVFDNFFELGGQSLLATQVIARIRTALQIEFPISNIFEGPTIAELAIRIDAVGCEGKAAKLPANYSVPRGRPLPLSLAQQRLWFLNRLDSASPAYNIPLAIQLNGELDAHVLKRSLLEIIRRHETLRTNFVERDGTPFQLVKDQVSFEVQEVDLSILPEESKLPAAKQFMHQEARTPFDLAVAPLLRAQLIKLTDVSHILILNMHHIVSDGWSMGILFWELAQLYEGHLSGQMSLLPALRIQYADFAWWQREWLEGETLERQLSYWREQLEDAPAALELPADHRRPSVQSFNGAREELTLPASLNEKLKELSNNEGATLYMLLLAAFQLLLSKYSRTNDILVGSPTANRNQQDVEPLIGFFVNTLVMRTDLSGDPTFTELLKRVKAVALGAFANQDLPFEKVVSELRPERTLSRNPLFQVMFVLQNAPARPLAIDGLSVKQHYIDTHATKFDLTLSLIEREGKLDCRLEYDTDLFEAATIARMLRHFRTLLEGIVANPKSQLSNLALLTDAERDELITSRNVTAREYRAGVSIHELIEDQAQRWPNRQAVVFDEQSLSYAELNERANQLAHLLIDRGATPDTRIGLLLNRSVEMVVAILGILKAGCAYVPLNTLQPPAKLERQLSAANAPIVITEECFSSTLQAYRGESVYIDLDRTLFETQKRSNPGLSIDSQNLAYVIFTSGSTGTPKGVAVTHTSLVNYTEFIGELLSLDKETNPLSFATTTTLAADLGNTCLFPALVTGGCLHVLSYETTTDPARFAAYTSQNPIDVMKIVPSHLSSLLSADPSGTILPRRYLILGGEALPSELFRRVSELKRECHIVNHYGPTEATIGSLTFVPNNIVDDCSLTVPIGGPIANTRAYILDAHLNPVPQGVHGDLYLAGVGLARCYVNSAIHTADSFLPNPFSTAGGERMYRTGDMARYLSDGSIEFLGRADNQIKLHGYRIEPGEIESALASHPEIRHAVVVACEGSAGDKRLVGYLVPAGDHLPPIASLRDFLRKTIPDYMIPNEFVKLDRLPLTQNGKIDKTKLPETNKTIRDFDSELVAPRTPGESVLAEIWSSVLGMEQIGVHDNFFELGGDSIMTIQIIAKAARAGLRFTPKELFRYQTISELIAAKAAESTGENLIIAEQGLVSGTVPLTPIQLRFFEFESPEPHHYNQSLLLELSSRIEAADLEQAVAKLQIHHDVLRHNFRQHQSRWTQTGAVNNPAEAVTSVDLSNEADQSHALELESAGAQASLDLESGAMCRFVLFELGADRPQQLLIVIHHLLIDSVSWRILLEDLNLLLEQRSGEKHLPAKTTSFKYWAESLQVYAQSVELDQEKQFWLSEERRSLLPLPVDFSSDDRTIAAAESIKVELDQAETDALLRDVPRTYRTQINDSLLTALLMAFERWTGETRLLVEMEGHGREEIINGIDLSRTAGWFTTRFPMVLKSTQGAEPSEILRSVKEQLRAIPRRGIGYGLLRYLRDEPALQAQMRELMQPEISFNYLGQFDQTLAGTNFKLSKESKGAEESPRRKQRYLLDINCAIIENRLQIEWLYSRNAHKTSTVETLAANFVSALRTLIEHSKTIVDGGFTPSDFPEANLSQNELDDLIAQLN